MGVAPPFRNAQLTSWDASTPPKPSGGGGALAANRGGRAATAASLPSSNKYKKGGQERRKKTAIEEGDEDEEEDDDEGGEDRDVYDVGRKLTRKLPDKGGDYFHPAPESKTLVRGTPVTYSRESRTLARGVFTNTGPPVKLNPTYRESDKDRVVVTSGEGGLDDEARREGGSKYVVEVIRTNDISRYNYQVQPLSVNSRESDEGTVFDLSRENLSPAEMIWVLLKVAGRMPNKNVKVTERLADRISEEVGSYNVEFKNYWSPKPADSHAGGERNETGALY